MIRIIDIAQSAGFLEGEGCFLLTKTSDIHHDPRITATQKQKDPLNRLQSLFSGKIGYRGPCKSNPKRNIFEWQLSNRKAVSLMMTIYPLMSPRRQKKIKEILNVWKSTWDNKAGWCRKGHLRTVENTIFYTNGHKMCKICRRTYMNKYNKNYREAA